MGDDPYDIVEGQQGVTLDLSVNVLALSAHSQQFHKVDVIHERAVFIHAVSL